MRVHPHRLSQAIATCPIAAGGTFNRYGQHQPDGTNGVDTYLLSTSPTTNNGTEVGMWVGESNNATDKVARSLIQFDLSSIPSNAVITSATLSLWPSYDFSDNDRTIRVYRLKVPFDESQATWNEASTGVSWQSPGASGTNDRESTDVGSILIPADQAIDVEKQISLSTAQIQEMVDGTFTNNGFILVADTELDDRFTYRTSDASAATKRPKLVIQYTVPQGRSPSNGFAFTNYIAPKPQGQSGSLILRQAQDMAFTPADDVHIQSASPTNNYGSATTLEVDNSPIKHFLLKFDVTGVNGQTVTNAKIRLYNVDAASAGGDFYHVVDDTWQEETVTWNNAPAAETTLLASLGSVSTNTWYEVDVTSLVTGDGTYSFRISDSVGGADYSSKEGANAPQLVLTLDGTPVATHTPTSTPTNTPTPGPSPTPTNTAVPTATPTTPPSAPFNNATFVYDGDGRRVKSIFNGTITTYFVGAHYEVTGSTITKYYYAGGQRIAMRTNSTLNYLLGDHLGSTSLTTDANGQVVSELRYKAWGEVRYANGNTLTKYSFTGQFSHVNDFGLMFYNARWLDVSLGRFAQADTITPKGVQGLDRYAYVNNSPLRFTDPSGHRACDDEYDCESHQNRIKGCSVLTGSFNGSFTCTPADLNRATIAQRQSWLSDMLAFVNPALVEEFNNINGILNAFIATESGAPDTWTSWGDAGILNSIQNGLALFRGETPILDSSPLSEIAANAWYDYFASFKANGPTNETVQLWGAAEGAGTTYGRWLAQEHGTTKSPGEIVFLFIGDVYRDGLSVRQDPATMTGPQWSADLYGWFFDPSSTIPGTDIAPVSLVAYFLLQK